MGILKKFGNKMRKAERAQVLPTALILGAVLMIFALVMVSMLSTTIKLSNKVHSGTGATLGSDAVVDKAINTLSQGDNWGSGAALEFTPIPGYKADRVYTDIPDSKYVVQINPGNLLSPPGDLAYERTISVDMYTYPKGSGVPTALPTPWTQGGPKPEAKANHRTLQAVVRRGSMTASIVAGGSIATNGNFTVWWGDIYNYKNVGPTVEVIDLGNNANTGPGYPAYHSKYGCIKSQGSCAGCLGTGSGSGAVFCNITDAGAAICKIYPKDPNMPPQPVVDLEALKAKARIIYIPGTGHPGAGLNSGESGYFYYSATLSSGVTGPNSIAVSCGGCTIAANERNHQYNASNPFGNKPGGSNYDNAHNVLRRMAVNLGQPLPYSGWIGNDDLVFFVDTTDGLPLASNLSNGVIGTENFGTPDAVDFKAFAFRGTYVLLGNFAANGPQSGPSITMQPPVPNSAWCPGPITDTPNFNGFLYIGGNVEKLTGTPLMYGSVCLEGDFNASGNVKLYYRSDFNYGLVTSGMIATSRWQEVKSFPTPLP